VLLLLTVIICAAASRRRRCRRFHPVDVWRSVRRKQTSGQGEAQALNALSVLFIILDVS